MLSQTIIQVTGGLDVVQLICGESDDPHDKCYSDMGEAPLIRCGTDYAAECLAQRVTVDGETHWKCQHADASNYLCDNTGLSSQTKTSVK